MATGQLIIGVGVATLDIVNRVTNYPAEDAEMRAIGQRLSRGGNVTNSLTVLSQFGHQCAWLGTCADDHAAMFIMNELRQNGIVTDQVIHHPGTTSPTSFITVSQLTGSRTIVHYRTLPELTADEFAQVSLDNCRWIHFEGRQPDHTAKMIARVQHDYPHLPISIEIEKNRPGIEGLLLPVQALLFSRAFIIATGAHDPRQFLIRQQSISHAALCIAAWGADGAYAVTNDHIPQFVPAYRPPMLIETLAAGDVFNAAIIDGLLKQLPLVQVLTRAVHLSGYHCGREGLDGLIKSAAAAGIL
ncbi:PfkB family carbohydrate kinase [Thiospirillum jenense]|uniref:Ketohexokinase n=1 Tax=Thiospirillum jenense TaxID=1653858 RepID=A0A839HDR1_9GAMM|nr:PfkB family carbohydrate kinase [Thiospirillum jenense]MBB1125388.1 ketohexokinase [Thiospirillum jenense]